MSDQGRVSRLKLGELVIELKPAPETEQKSQIDKVSIASRDRAASHLRRHAKEKNPRVSSRPTRLV
ncbi:hypothetical protein DY000_02060797 [Brassica cretica]|uniref:Uncharacterized protein n=1 Tax=Brassica cretica TaxID=69181 RepID=A0ABQ7B0P8_BRACR|nr:hypothetical protein DY000_02060797 [Brassica cretica]